MTIFDEILFVSDTKFQTHNIAQKLWRKSPVGIDFLVVSKINVVITVESHIIAFCLRLLIGGMHI